MKKQLEKNLKDGVDKPLFLCYTIIRKKQGEPPKWGRRYRACHFLSVRAALKKLEKISKNLLTNQNRYGIINSERLREEHKAQAGSTGFTLTKGQVRSFGEPADLLQKLLDKLKNPCYNKEKEIKR